MLAQRRSRLDVASLNTVSRGLLMHTPDDHDLPAAPLFVAEVKIILARLSTKLKDYPKLAKWAENRPALIESWAKEALVVRGGPRSLDLTVALNILMDAATADDGSMCSPREVVIALEKRGFGQYARGLAHLNDELWERHTDPAVIEDQLVQALVAYYPRLPLPLRHYSSTSAHPDPFPFSDLDKYLSTFTPMQATNVARVLHTKALINGEQTTWANLVLGQSKQGPYTRAVQFQPNKNPTRTQFNRMNWDEERKYSQTEYEKGLKVVYQLARGETTIDVPKTVFDFASYLGIPLTGVSLIMGYLDDSAKFAKKAIAQHPEVFSEAQKPGVYLSYDFKKLLPGFGA